MFNFSSLMITKFFYLLALSVRNGISSVRRLLVGYVHVQCMSESQFYCYRVLWNSLFLNHFPRFFSRNLLPVSQLEFSLFFCVIFSSGYKKPICCREMTSIKWRNLSPFSTLRFFLQTGSLVFYIILLLLI